MALEIARRTFLKGGASLAALAGAASILPRFAFAATDEFAALDGTAQAQLVRAGEVTASELLEAAIARIERFNPTLNALVTPLFDRARATATRANTSAPFAGVPYLLKDLLELDGAPTIYGSRMNRGNVSSFTSPYVQRMEDAGLNILGKSATPEFGLLPTTEPLLSAPTHNPWNTDYSSGGSSGGSAVAVAAGLVPFANATDGGGSIRIPASCCGLFGLMPSRGRQLQSRAHSSPIDISRTHCVSRSVRDSAHLLSLTEQTGAEAPFGPAGHVEGPSARRRRIAFSTTNYFGNEPHRDVRSAIEQTAALCESLGHDVEAVAPPINGEEFLHHFMGVWAAGAAAVMAQYHDATGAWPDDTILEPWTLGLGGLYQTYEEGAVPNALAYFAALRTTFDDFFSGYDFALTPVLGAPPPELGFLAPTVPFDTLYDRVINYVTYTAQINATGLPAMSVPLGMSSGGLPIGSQFVAGAGREAILFELAYELEAAAPWADRWPTTSAVYE